MKSRHSKERKIGVSTFVVIQSIMLVLVLLIAFALSSVAHAADITATESEEPKENPEENYIFELIGEKKMLLEAGKEFVDPGAVLLDENRNLLYMLFVYSDEVTILDAEGARHPELETYASVSGKVATETEGEYLRKITYKDRSVERLITVLEKPKEGLYKPEGDVELFYTLKLKGASESIVKSGTQFKDPGVEVYDQFWIRHPELEKEVKTVGKVDTKQVKYYLWQYDLNGESINSIVRVVGQKEALALRLVGKKEVTITAGQTFKIEGAKVFTKGGLRRQDLDKEIVIRGTVNTLKPGDYILIFDLDGVTITQLVHVVKPDDKGNTKNTNSNGTSTNNGTDSREENNSGTNPGGNPGTNPGGNSGTNPGGDITQPDAPPAGENDNKDVGEGTGGTIIGDAPPAGEDDNKDVGEGTGGTVTG